jgi:hypothetical protein
VQTGVTPQSRKLPGRSDRRPGPVGKTQKAFEEVARLPRSQQDKIVEALVDQFKRKAS